MSSWLWSMEPRFTMAAPNCFVTTFLLNLENENGQDCEQCPPGILGHGLENAVNARRHCVSAKRVFTAATITLSYITM